MKLLEKISSYLGPILSVLAAALCVYIIVFHIDLNPKVNRNFFFSESDPHLQTENTIAKLFPQKSQALVMVTYREPRHNDHLELVENLTRNFSEIDGVTSVTSLTRGPGSVDDAYDSPLWSRLLLSPDGDSSNIVIALSQDQDKTSETIQVIEAEVNHVNSAISARLALSGIPYIVTKITQRLTKEVKKFSFLSFAVFFVLIFLLFRSLWILVGSLTACLVSSCLTFIVLDVIGSKPGILTANLWSIVCVMTLSHAVFLTVNFRGLNGESSPKKRRNQAIKITLGASIASMVTTFLGFLSLLFVDAQPMRQFGVGGSVGAVVAIFSVYLVLPNFLSLLKTEKRQPFLSEGHLNQVRKVARWLWIPILILIGLAIPRLGGLRTDPPLSNYFNDDDPVRKHLRRIDKEGGTSPIELIVEDREGLSLTESGVVDRLWKLQQSLEEQSQVGSIISLPVLLKEANRASFAFLLTWEGIVEALEAPEYNSIASNFITRDRKKGRFMIRMNDVRSSSGRDDIIANLNRKVRAEGFEPVLVGGFFTLQHRMSVLVERSMVQGLVCLVVLFFLVALVISRSLWVSISMILSLSLVPFLLLGIANYCKLALDVVSAPAANIAIAMGIDSMLHFVRKRRFLWESGTGKKESWDEAFKEIFQPILFATLIVGLGFGVFIFSSFQSTINLGILVVCGTLISAVITLGVFPSLASLRSK